MSTKKLTNCVQGSTIGNVRLPGIPGSVKGTFVAHGENWAIHFQHVTGSSRIVNDRKSCILVCHMTYCKYVDCRINTLQHVT